MSNTIEQESDEQKRLIPAIYVVGGILLILALAGALIFGVLWLAGNYPAELEAVRDIFIIGLALQSCIFGIVLILMLTMIIRLVNTVEFEIKPILQQTNETIGNVRGTTSFVSKNVVKPVTKATSYAAGFRKAVKTLIGNPEDNLAD